jgi:hypothetical protein
MRVASEEAGSKGNSYSQKARRQKPLALTAKGTPAPRGGDLEPPPRRTELNRVHSLSRKFRPSLSRKREITYSI